MTALERIPSQRLASPTQTSRPRQPSLAPPWHVAELAPTASTASWELCADDYQSVIATTAAWEGKGSIAYEQGKAIAHLISSAPDLFAALKLAHRYLQQYADDTKRSAWGDDPAGPRAPYQLQAVLIEVEAALRRARGEGW